jgi:hypothetical protein
MKSKLLRLASFFLKKIVFYLKKGKLIEATVHEFLQNIEGELESNGVFFERVSGYIMLFLGLMFNTSLSKRST